jgi:DNA-binding response OmpR family regulator
VLVVDPSDSARSVLEVALSRDGFDVWSVASGHEGLALLQKSTVTPDVVVLEADLGAEDGFSFCSALRGDARTAEVPVVLLASPEARSIAALAEVVGVDDFIHKPAFARDVAALVRIELARGAGGEASFETAQLLPSLLLRALLSTTRSGRLELAQGHGRVAFVKGQVVEASFDGVQGLDALVKALALTRGSYRLTLEPVTTAPRLHCTSRELVHLVFPRLAKWAEVVQRSLPLEARLAVDFGRLAQALPSLPQEVNHLVRLFDGRRTVEQVLIDSQFEERLTLEVTNRLYLMGVVMASGPVAQALEVPRPAPRLFEPRSTEAEELMRELFAGEAEIRAAEVAPAASGAHDDWFEPAQGSGLEASGTDDGWTLGAPLEALGGPLEPALQEQIDAFNTPTHVDVRAATLEEKSLEAFVAAPLASPPAEEGARPSTGDEMAAAMHLSLSVDEPMGPIDPPHHAPLDPPFALSHVAPAAVSSALFSEVAPAAPVVESPSAEPRSAAPARLEARDARLVTPLLTPAVSFDALPAPTPARTVTPVLMTAAVEPADLPVSVVAQAPSATPSVEEAFFDGAPTLDSMPAVAAPEAAAVDEAAVVGSRKKLGLLGLAVVGLLLAVGLEMAMGSHAPEPVAPPPAVEVVAAPAPAPVPAPVVVDQAPPEPVSEVAVSAIDVTEPLRDAKAAYEAGNYKKALSVLEQVVSDDPKSVDGWLFLGLTRYDTRDAAGAKAASEQVLALDPNNARVQLLLATLHFDANEKDLARAALERYLTLEPKGPNADEARALLAR